jgi:hypothetical protein
MAVVWESSREAWAREAVKWHPLHRTQTKGWKAIVRHQRQEKPSPKD